MRHNKKFNHLSRKKAHRDALLANMTISLIQHKRIITTLAKAKALRVYAEPLINRAKTDDTHSRRLVFKHLQNKYAVSELFNNIAQKIADRPGGYTRILKIGNRLSDDAKMCLIELVDYNEAMLKDKNEPAKKASTRRSRRKSAAKAAPAEETPAAVEEPKAEKQPAAEEIPTVEETPAVEEAPAGEDAPKSE